MRKAYMILAVAFIATFGSGVLVGHIITPPTRDNATVHITSLEDGAVIHSKVWIDASFPQETFQKEVIINGTKVSNYVPFLWNNIKEKAGRYQIKVIGRYRRNGKNKTAQTNITIEIPVNEIFVGNRNNFTEDHVIHEGQNVLWQNGHFNLSTSLLTNGAGVYVPHWLDIYGNLTMNNITLSGIAAGDEGGVGTDMPRINVRGNGMLTVIDSDFHADGIAKVICVFENGSVSTINSTYSEIRYY